MLKGVAKKLTQPTWDEMRERDQTGDSSYRWLGNKLGGRLLFGFAYINFLAHRSHTSNRFLDGSV